MAMNQHKENQTINKKSEIKWSKMNKWRIYNRNKLIHQLLYINLLMFISLGLNLLVLLVSFPFQTNQTIFQSNHPSLSKQCFLDQINPQYFVSYQCKSQKKQQIIIKTDVLSSGFLKPSGECLTLRSVTSLVETFPWCFKATIRIELSQSRPALKYSFQILEIQQISPRILHLVDKKCKLSKRSLMKVWQQCIQRQSVKVISKLRGMHVMSKSFKEYKKWVEGFSQFYLFLVIFLTIVSDYVSRGSKKSSNYVLICLMALFTINEFIQECKADPCPTLNNCLACSSQNVCTNCQSGYFINGDNRCQTCSSHLPNCLTCQPWHPCLSCQSGYLLQYGHCNFDPASCALPFCQTCDSPSSCSDCISNEYYLDSNDDQCYSCSQFDPNCVSCDNLNVCSQCQDDYFIKTHSDSSTSCESCSTISNCIQCSSSGCAQCFANFYVQSGQCQSCSSMDGCLTCSDGSQCQTCDVGWQLSSSTDLCVCDPDASNLLNCQSCDNPNTCTACDSDEYYLSDSDNRCYPCSNFDTNCLECSDFEECTQCQVTYGIETNPDSSTICLQCSIEILNCVQCLVTSTCTRCDDNYYVTSNGDCELCSQPIPGCLTCSPTASGVECQTCDVGWNLDSHECECNPGSSQLNNCETCEKPSKCLECESQEYYLDPTDFKCYSCSNFDSNCLECHQFNQCSKCATTYGMITYSSGTKMCLKCNSTLNGCAECTVVDECTNCDFGYGLNSANTCSSCGSMFSGCVECQTSAECLGCENTAYLISGICRYCSEIPNCQQCESDYVELSCFQCSIGFYMTQDPITGQSYCRVCKDLIPYCTNCSSTQCAACQTPYLLGNDNTCSACDTGYQYNNGLCTNITGCQSVLVNPQGEQVCIACVQSLNFIMDQITSKCICTIGHKQIIQNNKNSLPKCQPICGDGIVISQKEQCDDNNTLSNDGCSSACSVEPDFDCSSAQPSICQLRIDIASITFNHVYRELGKNSATMSFQIYPKHNGLSSIKWENMVQFNFSSTAVDPKRMSFKYIEATGELLITFPYTEELEAQSLQTSFTLDPTYILSKSTSFMLAHSLKGVNAPLIFQEETQLATQKNINLITLLLTILLLLQFYAGSYSHKMIGLETIQVIQSIYFVRMVAGSSSSSLMNSINSIQYSAGGYQNANIFYGDTTDLELSLLGSTDEAFLKIDLKKFFLLNVNVSLFPVIIAITLFIIFLIRKYRTRSQYLQIKQQYIKDLYTTLRRSCQWLYDHLVFPYVMMFSLISYFQTILLLSSKSTLIYQFSEIESQSFIVHIILTFCTVAIYCFELFNSFEAYSQYCMSERERQKIPKSTIQKLEHDENNLDKANYHPAYILSYLVYYFLLSLCMAGSVVLPQFQYTLEVNMGLAIIYFLLIIWWKPYSGVVNVHNYFIKFNHAVFVVFLVFCYIFTRLQSLGSRTYIVIMYLVTVLIACVMTGGFIRIYIEYCFRKALEKDKKLLPDKSQEDEVKENPIRDDNLAKISRKDVLLMNNQYTFENQLKEYEKGLIYPNGMMSQTVMKNLSVSGKTKKQYLINKMRQQIYRKNTDLFGKHAYLQCM